MPDGSREKSSRGGIIVGIGLRGRGGKTVPVSAGILTGGIVAIVGILILLENLGVHVVSRIWLFWPVILIVVGILNLSCKSGRVFGAAVLVLGILFQLDTLGIWHFRWAQLWPLAIIFAGFVIMWGSLRKDQISERVRAALNMKDVVDPSATLNEVAIFGGIERRVASPDFRGGFVQAVFGGVELDLRDSTMIQEEVKLEINAIFGGVELRIPDNWHVVSHGQAFFGGYVDETRNYRSANPTDPGTKSLILTGSAVFGGVEIKN
jgi:predicted membrane protein